MTQTFSIFDQKTSKSVLIFYYTTNPKNKLHQNKRGGSQLKQNYFLMAWSLSKQEAGNRSFGSSIRNAQITPSVKIDTRQNRLEFQSSLHY